MSKNNISEILKRLLFEHNLKAVDLAKLTDVPQPTVQRLVAGSSTRPHEKSLIPIAKYFNLSLEQLRGEMPIHNATQTKRTLDELGAKLVSLLEWNQVKSWLNHTIARDPTNATIITASPVTQNCFALIIKDSSMEPLFPVGTTVIFNPEKEPKDRHYALVSLKDHEEPVFRQLLLDAGDRFIKPLSPDLDHFRVHLLDKEDKIIGALVEAKQQYTN